MATPLIVRVPVFWIVICDRTDIRFLPERRVQPGRNGISAVFGEGPVRCNRLTPCGRGIATMRMVGGRPSPSCVGFSERRSGGWPEGSGIRECGVMHFLMGAA